MNEKYYLPEIGLYPDAIGDVANDCKNIIEEARTLMCNYGTEEEQYTLSSADLGEMVQEKLQDNCNFSDMTNSIISAYYESVKRTLALCPTFEELEVSFKSYTNSSDSHFYIETPQGVFNYSDGELITVTEETISGKYAEELEPLVEKLLENSGEEYPKDWIVEDLNDVLEGGYVPFDMEDVKTSIEKGELTESIARHIEENAQPIEKEVVKKKEQIERD